MVKVYQYDLAAEESYSNSKFDVSLKINTILRNK